MPVLNYVSPVGEAPEDRAALFAVVHDAALQRASRSRHEFSREHAADIAQEVVAEFASADYALIEDPAAWANRVAGNVGARMWRKQMLDAPEVVEEEPKSRAEAQRAIVAFLVDGRPTSQAGLMHQQADLLIGQLSERELELVLGVADGMSHADIAARMGYAGADSVKTTLARIRRKILAAAESAGIDVEWADHPRPY
jgi:DNA-directed RNA polymerase specialized sigma24 family protein